MNPKKKYFLNHLCLLSLLMAFALKAIAAEDPLNEWGYEEEPSDNQSYVDAIKFIQKEKYGSALISLKTVPATATEYADAQFLLAFSYEKLGQKERAEKHYLTTLQVNPKHLVGYKYLGLLYLSSDQLAKAHLQLAKLEQLCNARCAQYKKLARSIKKYEKKKYGDAQVVAK